MTGDMFTHDDEPATKKSTVNDPDDGADMDALVFAHPGVAVLLLGNIDCQTEEFNKYMYLDNEAPGFL